MHRRHPIRVFQSTHPARGATLPLRQATRRLIYFNPRTPRGVRLARNTVIATPVEFQSTHPARGATTSVTWPRDIVAISIHAPREGCDSVGVGQLTNFNIISIHAPREGCDLHHTFINPNYIYFNPRTPRGVRQATIAQSAIPRIISIHAPREGCDYNYLYLFLSCLVYFNPRTPRGVRPFFVNKYCPKFIFQSTHPARGATGPLTLPQR